MVSDLGFPLVGYAIRSPCRIGQRFSSRIRIFVFYRAGNIDWNIGVGSRHPIPRIAPRSFLCSIHTSGRELLRLHRVALVQRYMDLAKWRLGFVVIELDEFMPPARPGDLTADIADSTDGI
jgi:hypothetical protein